MLVGDDKAFHLFMYHYLPKINNTSGYAAVGMSSFSYDAKNVFPFKVHGIININIVMFVLKIKIPELN